MVWLTKLLNKKNMKARTDPFWKQHLPMTLYGSTHDLLTDAPRDPRRYTAAVVNCPLTPPTDCCWKCKSWVDFAPQNALRDAPIRKKINQQTKRNSLAKCMKSFCRGVLPFLRQVSSKDAFRQNLAHVFQPQPSPKQTLAHVCPSRLPITSPRSTGNQMGKRSAPVVAHKPSGLGHRWPCYLKISKNM